MSQQSAAQSRQPTSYPSPHSYPSPTMSPYAYPPPTSGHGVEPYRASPTGSHISLPSVNTLPPIRNIDTRSPSQPQQQNHQASSTAQQAQQQTSGQNPMGSPLPPPPMTQNMTQYYHAQVQSLPPSAQHMNVTSDPNQPVRYPLPAADNRMMSGGRHKKEIKRRTKTGCLTCRKRRIKCDELHPICRNCIKSKRECAGYDPIFKPQPGPAAIQPAPSSAPSMQPTSATSSHYPPPPQGYMPVAAQPYAPSLTAGVNSPGSSAEPYDYSAAIDPALEGAGTSQMQVPISYDGTLDIRQGVAKPTKIEDLLLANGVPPPTISTPPSIPPSTYEEIKNVYSTIYAGAIDKFLETRWFTTRGLIHLKKNSRLCEQYATLINRYSSKLPTDFQHHATLSLESTVIWSTMCICREVSAAVAASNEQNIEVTEGVHEASKRLDVLETLVTNQYHEGETLSHPTSSTPRNVPMLNEQLKYREREFWRLISKFVTLHDDEASSAKEIDDTLTSCRHLLDSRENRDVIYSIAIARHVGQRMAEAHGAGNEPIKGKETNDEADGRQKLLVAKNFIHDQATGKGTTQVVQRVCEMAIRSWGGGR